MSRSQPALTNPSQHFFKWSGSKGSLSWWDKENSREVPVRIPFEFLVLDELATITGFCEPDKSSYWSNEVRNISKDELTVRTSHGIKQAGLYSTLTDVRSKGAKYAKSIYIAHKIGDEWVMGNIKASGAALTAWIELGQKHSIQSGKIRLIGSEEAQKGATTYHIPTFEWDNTTPEEEDIAVELDRELQVYLSQYLAQPHVTEAEQEIVDGVTTDELPEVVNDGRHLSRSGADHDDPESQPQSGYEKAKAQAAKLRQEKDEDAEIRDLVQTHREDVQDEQEEINIDDIPF